MTVSLLSTYSGVDFRFEKVNEDKIKVVQTRDHKNDVFSYMHRLVVSITSYTAFKYFEAHLYVFYEALVCINRNAVKYVTRDSLFLLPFRFSLLFCAGPSLQAKGLHEGVLEEGRDYASLWDSGDVQVKQKC